MVIQQGEMAMPQDHRGEPDADPVSWALPASPACRKQAIQVALHSQVEDKAIGTNAEAHRARPENAASGRPRQIPWVRGGSESALDIDSIQGAMQKGMQVGKKARIGIVVAVAPSESRTLTPLHGGVPDGSKL
jgi:hypothetical protein